MNWISNVVRPKIRSFLRRETPENLWIKCPETGQLVFFKDVEANQFVIPSSNYHMRISATARLKLMFDGATWLDIGVPEVAVDPLKFRDERRYVDRLKDAKTKTGLHDAVKLGLGKLDGLPVVIAVQDFDFMGGSLGMAAGEAVIKGVETAVQKGTPFIMFAASGGARMQEGILSLMQLPRTTVALAELREAGLPYIVVLTDPTTGGVTASYAMLGDVQLAEPGALIGFAGQLAIGYVALLTLGAYTTSVLVSGNVLPPVPVFGALAIAGVAGAVFGVIVGLPALRLRTFYFAMTTLGFATIVTQVALAWQSVTGGGIGLPGPEFPAPFNTHLGFYFFCLAAAAFVTWMTSNVAHSRFGRGLIAIRDADVAAEATGIRKARLLVVVFIFAGACAAMAGVPRVGIATDPPMLFMGPPSAAGIAGIVARSGLPCTAGRSTRTMSL